MITPPLANSPAPVDNADKLTHHELEAWQQSRVKDLWRIFRVMSEFVDGFETLSRLGPCVSIFGSARTPPGDPYYQMAEDVAARLVEAKYGVITGGGPGIMEAANKGAHQAGGVSVGLNIVIPHEQSANPYIDRDKLINFDFFFVRKVMFIKYAQGFIVLPGGYGTLDEFFEAITLIQTGKSTRFPIILMGTQYWQGLIGWIESVMMESAYIGRDERELFTITDDPAEAVAIIDAFYREHAITPNF